VRRDEKRRERMLHEGEGRRALEASQSSHVQIFCFVLIIAFFLVLSKFSWAPVFCLLRDFKEDKG
jgi:hypothetical protein